MEGTPKTFNKAKIFKPEPMLVVSLEEVSRDLWSSADAATRCRCQGVPLSILAVVGAIRREDTTNSSLVGPCTTRFRAVGPMECLGHQRRARRHSDGYINLIMKVICN